MGEQIIRGGFWLNDSIDRKYGYVYNNGGEIEKQILFQEIDETVKHMVMIIISVVRAVAAVIVLLVLARAVYFYFIQGKLVYAPYRTMSQTPNDVGLAYREVAFSTSDGEFLSAWLIPNDKSDLYLLFCHGNAGNVSHRNEYYKVFHSLGFNIFIFDYRGYGRSSGSPSEEGTYLDSEAAWNYLVECLHVRPERIVVLGRSLGGAVAARIAARNKPLGVILECAFTSIPDLAAEMVPFFPARFLVRFNYPTKEYIAAIHCPVLIMHSPDDRLIPFSHGEKLFNAAPRPKMFLPLSGGHNDAVTVSGKEYRDGVKRFLSSLERCDLSLGGV